jgi:hypothetical protein
MPMEVRHDAAWLGMANILTCRQTDANCCKTDNGFLPACVLAFCIYITANSRVGQKCVPVFILSST